MKTSFSPIITNATHSLFLGTLPGEISLLEQKYYAHPQNKFWQLFYDVFNQNYELEYDKRIEFLQNKGFGLWDVVKSANRKGSLDTAIKNFEINDFEYLHEQYPKIQRLYFTSKQAYKWYYKIYKNRLNFELIILPSPSPANARITYNQKLEKWKELIVK